MARHKWSDVIHAFAEGKEIQWRWVMDCGSDGTWYDTNPEFNNESVEFRIKPEKKPDIISYRYIPSPYGFFEEAYDTPNVKCTFDGENGVLKFVEMIND
jgi:hypothetical protein